MALIEARREGIHPFCLTVDKEGNDYLRTMMDDFSYEVLGGREFIAAPLAAVVSQVDDVILKLLVQNVQAVQIVQVVSAERQIRRKKIGLVGSWSDGMAVQVSITLG